MSGPVFPTKWDFLFASVLIGVDRSTGVFSGSEPTPGRQMVCVWTSEDVAIEALHVESWELQKITVRDLLTMLPAGIGVVVDPERTSGMTASASYVANLKRYVPAFPADTTVHLGAWDDLPAAMRDAIGVSMADADLVSDLRAFVYTVDDSPALGCLAYVARPGTRTTGAVVEALDTVLSTAPDVTDLGVPTVNILRLDDVPEVVRTALGDDHVLYRRRRSGFWRR